MTYELVIGLEVHLKLTSAHKLFCRCANVQEFENLAPNTHICPVCTGHPGALPTLNQDPLAQAIRLWLALNCHINQVSTFDRKSYFYPDLPTGYQITQQLCPTCVDGSVTFWVDNEFTQSKTVTIRDAHIEIDSGKTTHTATWNLLDYNRAGTPLVEIVTHPDFRDAPEVTAFLKEIQRIAKRNNLSDADMEKGQMRADVNISLRLPGEKSYGIKVEIKNMNSFSAVRRAIDFEYKRQSTLYDAGSAPEQETRGRDDAKWTSYVMRSKENAMDYRYMPEPDLPPLHLALHEIDLCKTPAIIIPSERIAHYKDNYQFNKEYINGLMSDPSVDWYFQQTLQAGHDAKLAATRIVWPIARWCNETQKNITDVPFSFDTFLQFLTLQAQGKLSNQQAKQVMKELLENNASLETLMADLPAAVDETHINIWLDEIFTTAPQMLADLRTGNRKPLWFVIWQLMQKSAGALDPKQVGWMIEKYMERHSEA